MAAVGQSAWWGLDREASVSSREAFETAVAFQPWGGPAWIPAAQRTLAELADPDSRGPLLRRLGDRYPLASTLWLEQARTENAAGASAEQIRQLLDTAVAVEPGNAEVRWQAAMVALEAGALDLAGAYLRQFVSLQPREVGRVVLVMRHWLRAPQEILSTLLPHNPDGLAYLLVYASSWKDWPLADAAWQRLSDVDAADAETVSNYVNQLLYAGRGYQAARAWSRVQPGFAVNTVSNGDFGTALQARSRFDWRVDAPEGAVIERDLQEFASAPAALHIHFDGKHNLQLNTPLQFIAVEPGRTYELTGRWRARGLTTLALPYWHIVSHSPDQWTGMANIQAAARSNWDWQAFSATFTVPVDAEVLRIQLVRDTTTNFDRNIGGDLWVDDIHLRAVKADIAESHQP